MSDAKLEIRLRYKCSSQFPADLCRHPKRFMDGHRYLSDQALAKSVDVLFDPLSDGVHLPTI